MSRKAFIRNIKYMISLCKIFPRLIAIIRIPRRGLLLVRWPQFQAARFLGWLRSHAHYLAIASDTLAHRQLGVFALPGTNDAK